MPSDKDDFRMDLTFSGKDRNYARPVAMVAGVAAVIFIIATMTTSVSSKILPMSDEYLLVLVPVAADGAEPLALKSLDQQLDEKTISVSGTVMNRADRVVSNLIAVIEMRDTTGRFPQTIQAPVQPVDLAPQATGTFMAKATLQEKPGAYGITFRLADGPFVPHKDDRGPAVSITPQPQSGK